MKPIFALFAVILLASFSFGQDFSITVLKHEATTDNGHHATILLAKGSDGNIYKVVSQSVGNRLDFMQPGAVLPAKIHRSMMAVTVTRSNGKQSTAHFRIVSVEGSDAPKQ